MRHERRRSQAGFTLVEVMITALISTMITIPLLAWMIVGFKTEGAIDRASTRNQAVNRLSADFAKDASSSSQMIAGGTSCGPLAAGETTVVSLLNGAITQRIVYLVATDAAGTPRLVRRTCLPDGSGISDRTVIPKLGLPAASAVTPTCTLPSSKPGADRCTLTIKLPSGPAVSVTGSRRTGLDQ